MVSKALIMFGISFMVTVAVGVITGGEEDIDNRDLPDVKEGQNLILNYLKKELIEVAGYKTVVSMVNVKVKRQIVAGMLYNYYFKAIYTFKSAENHIGTPKPPVIKTCNASVLRTLNGPEHLVIAKKPNCI